MAHKISRGEEVGPEVQVSRGGEVGQEVQVPANELDFIPKQCPIGGGPSCKKLFKRLGALTRHLTSANVHDMSLRQARKIIRDPKVGAKLQGPDEEDGEDEEAETDEEDDSEV